MIDWATCPAVERNPERVSGAWVFRGTRVPVSALFGNLEDGATLSRFVEWFPGVTLEQARGFRSCSHECACSCLSVRVLFDQGIPEPLRRALIGHDVATAYERGWSRLKNGDLLDAAEKAGISVLVTTDSSLESQVSAEFAIAPNSRGGFYNELATNSACRRRDRQCCLSCFGLWLFRSRNSLTATLGT